MNFLWIVGTKCAESVDIITYIVYYIGKERYKRMTQLKILNLAYMEALNKWGKEFEKLQKNPSNEFTKAREEKLWAEVEEIKNMVIAEETRESQTLKKGE